MNFLLHRHLAARDLGSAIAGVGAMLPDLWRMADKRVRAGHDIPGPRDGTPLGDVLDGVAHHIAADARFHAADDLHHGEEATRDAIALAGIRAPRMRLFAHPTWELLLDGALVRKVGAEAVTRDVRAGLDAATGALRPAAEVHHFSRVSRSSVERLAFEARMFAIAKELARGPWIAGYASGRGVAEFISRTRRRVGLDPLDDADLAALGEALEGLAPLADRTLERLLTPR